MANVRQHSDLIKTFTIDEYRKFSEFLEELVVCIVRRDTFDVKCQETFIDINNQLYEILQTNEYKNYPIYYILNGFKEKIDKLKELIYQPEKFMNFSIQFKFLSYDLDSLFPRGLHNAYFTLDSNIAEQWWKRNFDVAMFVEVTVFWKEFTQKFDRLSNFEAVMKSICFTQFPWFINVSKSSFNLFLKFYGGWDTLEATWLYIYNHSANMGMITREAAEEELLKVKLSLQSYRTIDKSYLFCMDWTSTEGLWNLLCGDETNSIRHSLLTVNELVREIRNPERYEFPRGVSRRTSSNVDENDIRRVSEFIEERGPFPTYEYLNSQNSSILANNQNKNPV